MSSLQSTAQIMVEEFPIIMEPQESGEHIVVYPTHPEPEVVMEMHDPETLGNVLEVASPMGEIEFEVTELPGVEALDPEEEAKLEVVENTDEKNKSDDEEVKKSKKAPKWDWESKGSQGFVAWIKERLSDVPKHSGYDTAGVERAISYMEKLDNEISKAMRLDLDGELDADKIEEVRAMIDEGVERLHARLDKISKKSKKKKKAEFTASLVKEGQKTPTVSGIVITVPLLISSIVRTCINGMVSAGHDIEDSFEKLANKYKLTDREKAECIQLFMDMGVPVRRDRGIMIDEDFDPTSSDNFDFASNRQA